MSGPSLAGRAPWLLAALAVLPACGLGGTWDGNLETREWSQVTGGDGIAEVAIDVDDHAAFQMTAMAGQYLAVERLTDPDGDVVVTWEDWYDTESLTGAFWLEGKDTVFNWPIRPEDGDLEPGTWTVDVASVTADGYYQGDTELQIVAKLKLDDDLDDGALQARVVFCDGLFDDQEVYDGVIGAVERWNEIWGPMGLVVDASFEASDFYGDLAFPGEDTAHEQVASGADGSEITILVGDTIDGSTDYLGVAGGIPGTLTETPRALVVASWLANAGPDGSFNAADIDLFGETLAHEVGHYMGLFHPVEIDYGYWDALSDTPSCDDQSSCESALGDNLMFPYPVCNGASCISQDQLSGDQQGVKHRYTGTL